MVKAAAVSRLDNTAIKIAKSAGEKMLQFTMMDIIICNGAPQGVGE